MAAVDKHFSPSWNAAQQSASLVTSRSSTFSTEEQHPVLKTRGSCEQFHDPSATTTFIQRVDTELGKAWNCTVCNQVVKSLSGITRHVRQRHINSPAYRCEICGIGLMSWSHYTGHMSSHSGVKNYECPQCAKRYFYKSDLSRHRKKCARVSLS